MTKTRACFIFESMRGISVDKTQLIMDDLGRLDLKVASGAYFSTFGGILVTDAVKSNVLGLGLDTTQGVNLWYQYATMRYASVLRTSVLVKILDNQ